MGLSGGTYTRTDGTYSGATVFAQEQAAGQGITAANLDAEAQDMANAITACLKADGTTAATGNLAMGSNKITGLAAGSNAADAVRYDQLTAITSGYMKADGSVTMTGALAMGSHKVSGVTAGTAATDAVILSQLEAAIFVGNADQSSLTLPVGESLITVGAAYAVSSTGHIGSGVIIPRAMTLRNLILVGQRTTGTPYYTFKVYKNGVYTTQNDALDLNDGNVKTRTASLSTSVVAGDFISVTITGSGTAGHAGVVSCIITGY